MFKRKSNYTSLKYKSKNVFYLWLCFFVFYILFNFSAYYQIFTYKIGKLFKQETVLEEIIPEANLNQIATEEKLIIKSKNSKKIKVPDLNLEITPPDNRIYIPKINKNVPIIAVPETNLLSKDFEQLEEDIQYALRDGVVHYPGTSLPDEQGNVVITGHSSYFPWDGGRFKDVFALIHDLSVGDEIHIFYNQNKYIYQVDNIYSVLPKEVDVLKPTNDNRLTLITCTPIGTNLKRLIVTARKL